MKTHQRSLTVATLLATGAVCPLFAKVQLGTPFTDGVVLQRERPVPIWGAATPGNEITVEFADETVKTVASPVGFWRVDLPPMSASKESRALTVSESEPGLFGSTVDEAVVQDVLVGEVWLCAGQSNTDCPIWGGNPHYRDGQGVPIMQMTVKPFVRLVKTPHVSATAPKRDYQAKWLKMTPEIFHEGTRTPMPSAMGYLYALELANALDIPIGLVDSSWGGTNIDAWTPRSGYENKPELQDVANLPILDDKAFNESRKNGVYKGKGIYGSSVQQPSALWNGLVAAYAPMAIRGFIWYQGCHNAGEYPRYAAKMHALYDGWAKEFANPDLKLYFVQLAPWGNKDIAKIQMAQARFEAEEPHAGMAVINDVGCLTDIHPNDKRTVAKRLALHALKRDYGFDWIVDNSPVVKSWKVNGDQVILSFRHAKRWYLYNPDFTIGTRFELAGEDGQWKPAHLVNLDRKDKAGQAYTCLGTIAGADLIVAADGVAAPRRLRYLHSAPWSGNLYSEAQLPLGAFALDLTVQTK